ncbi:cyclin-dependent protein kinase complex component [Sporothrix schenckii 1099-18]|uniref:Cyclin-dependent protein kinase complex component n=1 Tax=Sporothrix schenckii 1099-18 TaxID=1397361 RepID=A0A0F2MA19_SPOSC|nr:cyclin-dependent protein kinase complex component [Sporothrix schenckii 1099-18]KJR86538.1 cyclin-dependent protein kinase complex component [Sporothrix schenckii 1099-18]
MADDDQRNQSQDSGSTPDSPPPPPVPADDPSLLSSSYNNSSSDAPSPRLASLTDDIFHVTPLAALQMLGAGVEALVRLTGDIPPTPPPLDDEAKAPTNMRSMQAEKEVIVRTLSENSLARLREQAETAEKAEREDRKRKAAAQCECERECEREREHAERGTDAAAAAVAGDDRSTPPRDDNDDDDTSKTATSQPSTPSRSRLPPTPPPAKPMQMQMEIDGVHLRATSQSPTGGHASGTAQVSSSGAPILVVPPAEPYIVIGANSQPLNVQHSAITRKFYSKKTPPIGISEYLLRLHRFCPMSTGVYLATSYYIYRLAVSEKAIAVTRRNAHRLLLAGLRVAMKALEDLSYAHTKMARVGGVTEAELARLEINFCFLAGFELSVCVEDMRQHWMLMKSGRAVGSLDQDGTAAVMASMDSLNVNVTQRRKVVVS